MLSSTFCQQRSATNSTSRLASAAWVVPRTPHEGRRAPSTRGWDAGPGPGNRIQNVARTKAVVLSATKGQFGSVPVANSGTLAAEAYVRICTDLVPAWRAPQSAMTRAQTGAAGTIASLLASGMELASGLATFRCPAAVSSPVARSAAAQSRRACFPYARACFCSPSRAPCNRRPRGRASPRSSARHRPESNASRCEG